MLTAVKLQKKREKRADRRRFLRKKQRQFWTVWGADTGEQLYRIWRKDGHKWVVGKIKVPRGFVPKVERTTSLKEESSLLLGVKLLFGWLGDGLRKMGQIFTRLFGGPPKEADNGK